MSRRCALPLWSALCLGLAATSCALRITTGSQLPNATEGQPYSEAIETENGEGPLTWSGSPPANLNLNAQTGEISGTPNTAGGPFSFGVTVTDSASRSDSKTFELAYVVSMFSTAK